MAGDPAAAALRPGSAYAVNVLHHGQRDLAMRFAGWAGHLPRGRGSSGRCGHGVPHLAGRGAHFRCVARDVHDAGDHVLVVGLVEEFHAYGHEPLLFYRGAFEHLRDPLAAQPGTDIDLVLRRFP